jgi:3-deoxy-D-manno-octulosonic-acid transferase
VRFEIYAGIVGGLIRNKSAWRQFPSLEGKSTIWFHAASAGELEILVPLIEAAVNSGRQVCVSVFSPSAKKALKKLPDGIHYRGFSPAESEWRIALQRFGVSEVITAKYEAWPGLWQAATKLDIRITIVCAQMRSSLLWAKRFLGSFGVRLPRLRFFVLEESSIAKLKAVFPHSECAVSVDPRWLRVLSRSEKALLHESVRRWVDAHVSAPKPYWVIGSAWPEDMVFLKESIEKFPGTVWVVPHSLKERPDENTYKPAKNCILVDEMGFLTELYAIADRVWVGGGFGQGIHSTLEPSVYGIPVACGPKNVAKFFEAKELQESGQLTVCAQREKIPEWIEKTSHFQKIDLKLKTEMIDQLIRSIMS